MTHEQTDMFGGSVPLDELELTGHLRALALLYAIIVLGNLLLNLLLGAK